MAQATLNLTYTIGEKSIGGFAIDAFVVEEYNFANRLTNLTVEEGVNISDHVTEEPDTIDIEAFIGQTKFDTFEGAFDADLENVEIPDDPKSRIRQSYQELLRMKRERQPVDVVTGLDTYTDMVITSLSISRDCETGADLPFSMSFQKIKTVKTEETQINANRLADSSAKDQAAPIANVGTVGTTDITNSFKENWKQHVRDGKASRAEYQEIWGEPFPG